MELQELLYKVITESNLVRDEFVKIVKEEVERKLEIPNDEQEFRKLVLEYMRDHELALDQRNYDYVADQLKKIQDDKGKFYETVERTRQVNDLDKYSVEDLKDVLQVCLLKQCEKIEKHLKQQENATYEYRVERLVDMGAANIGIMSLTINSIASQGWHVKTIFTTSVSAGGIGSGINYTADDVVIVFERRVQN